MTGSENAELSRLLSSLMRAIHELPDDDVRILMDVDGHMRNDEVTKADLNRIRQISARLKGPR